MIQLNWSDEPGVWKPTAYRTVELAQASWDKSLADWIKKYGRPPMKATPNFREIPDEREPPKFPAILPRVSVRADGSRVGPVSGWP